MGYHSYLNFIEFKSNYSLEELSQIKNRLADAIDKVERMKYGVGEHLNYFDIVQNNKGVYSLVPEGEEYYSKHGDLYCLAIFVSLVIQDGDSCDITEEGEDGESWGWRVESGKIKGLKKTWQETEDIPTIISKEDFVEALI